MGIMAELTYEEWKLRVDLELLKRAGVTSHDLADHCYRDDYDNESSVEDTVIEVLNENDYPFADRSQEGHPPTKPRRRTTTSASKQQPKGEVK